MKPRVSIIVAMTQVDWIIGRNNKLPWNAPEDLKYFKKITMGAPIVMGRKTFDSIGKALPGRLNVVLSRQPRPEALDASVIWTQSLPEALATASLSLKQAEDSRDEIFIIGGAQLFAEALPMVSRLYITWIGAPYEGDCRFPHIALEKDFRLVDSQQGESLDPPLKFAIYDRS